jgi:hypothetical protein
MWSGIQVCSCNSIRGAQATPLNMRKTANINFAKTSKFNVGFKDNHRSKQQQFADFIQPLTRCLHGLSEDMYAIYYIVDSFFAMNLAIIDE